MQWYPYSRHSGIIMLKSTASLSKKVGGLSKNTWRPSGKVKERVPLEMPIAPRMAPAPVSSGISTHERPHDSFEQVSVYIDIDGWTALGQPTHGLLRIDLKFMHTDPSYM